MLQEFTDPTLSDLAIAWRIVTGYDALDSTLATTHRAIWAWPTGLLSTSTDDTSEVVHVVWAWDNGTVKGCIQKYKP